MSVVRLKLSVFAVVITTILMMVNAAWGQSIAPDIRPGPGVTEQRRLSDYFSPLKKSNLDTPVFILDSGKPGATALVIGGTHGNELAGQVAALVLIENVELREGRLIVVPYANRSALSVKDTLKQVARQHLIKGRSGMRFLPYGDRRTDPEDQGADGSDRYTNPSGYVLKNGKEARNLNRTYPGKSNGTPTEQLAYAILTMIKAENIDFCLDLHEARTPEKNLAADREYGGGSNKQLAYTLVAHPRGTEIAAYALLAMEADTNITMKLEESNPVFRGLSHREIGSATKCLAFLSESPNPGQDKWRIKPDVIRDEKYPLGHRVGIHLQIFKNLAAAFSAATKQPFVIKGLPNYQDVMTQDIGRFLN